ncbi:MAG: hypothetical protein ACI3V0_02930 [Faecousia sp.]
MGLKLTSSRGEGLTGTPWTIYPRPQLKRDSFLNLNGDGEFAAALQEAIREKAVAKSGEMG